MIRYYSSLIGILLLSGCSDSKEQEPDMWTYIPEEEQTSYDIEEAFGHLTHDSDAVIITNSDFGDFTTYTVVNKELCDDIDECNVMFSGKSKMTASYTNPDPDIHKTGSKHNLTISKIQPITGEIPSHTQQQLPKYTWAGQIVINTAGGAAITSKEDYVEATISMNHTYPDWNLDEVTAGIRGRGNSTWLWYPKKPYRIKFNKKQSLMGLPKAKSWVLLAEYRDPTNLMNAFVFELGNLMGLPFTNHNRYVELVLNGKSQGLYHLTEQVQQGDNRVNIDEAGGYLIQLDADDGPGLAPDATDNFWSAGYRMPVCVKNPDEPTPAILEEIKASLGELETAIAASNLAEVEKLLDVESMIDFLIIQELVYNVELDAPRSMYLHKDIGGDKWHMGPLWDFDAGFDFDWNNMTTSHNYFASYRELVLGTRPATHTGTQYRVPGFFSDMFKMSEFVTRYKARWAEVKELEPLAWENTVKFYTANSQLWYDDSKMWPTGKSYATEISSMNHWLDNRVKYLDTVVAGY